MLSKRMKDMLDRLTTDSGYDVNNERYEYRDDRLLNIIDGRPAAEYKKQRKMDEINSVKDQYDA
jgi:hypothetical protein